jgi:hypothetical protein
MRSLFKLAAVAAVSLCFFAAVGRAEEPTKYYLIDGQVTVEERVTSLEKKIADLEAQVATLKGTAKTGALNAVAKSSCTYCDNCTCAKGVCPACPAAKAADAPGVLTTTDGRKIAWAGTTYVFVDQPVYLGSPVPTVSAYGTCANGRCTIIQK